MPLSWKLGVSKGISILGTTIFLTSYFCGDSSSSDTLEIFEAFEGDYCSSPESSSIYQISQILALLFRLFSNFLAELIISWRQCIVSSFYFSFSILTLKIFGTSVFDFTITPFSSFRNVNMPTFLTNLIAQNAFNITSSAFLSSFISSSFALSSSCFITSTFFSSSLSFAPVLPAGFSLFFYSSEICVVF